MIILSDWFYHSHFVERKMKAKTWGLTSSHLASRWWSCDSKWILGDSKACVLYLPLLTLRTSQFWYSVWFCTWGWGNCFAFSQTPSTTRDSGPVGQEWPVLRKYIWQRPDAHSASSGPVQSSCLVFNIMGLFKAKQWIQMRGYPGLPSSNKL